ncbi:MAG: hypothetical protein ABI759_20920 [Candidatus Solibacter sp.]
MRTEEREKLRACRHEATASGTTASLKETLNFAQKFRRRSVEGLAARIDDNGPLWAQLIELEAHGLSYPSLDAVSHHGFAEGAGAGKTNVRPVRLLLADTECRE